MGFIIVKDALDPLWRRKRRRVLLSGPPNSGKTTSGLSFLENDKARMAYIGYPGEQGVSSLPDHPQITKFVWEEPDAGKASAWSNIWKDVEELTIAIITGKHGPFDVYFGDGLHKLHHVALCKVTAGEADKTLDFDAKLYDDARRLVLSHTRRLMGSSLGLVGFTVWEGWEKEKPGDRDKNAPQHIYPAFPGKLAKEIMGEFSVALYAKVEGVAQGVKYRWQTRPFGQVRGCGIKAPPAISGRIPTFVPQDWRKLWPYLAYEPKVGERVQVPDDVVLDEEAAEQPTNKEAAK